MDAAQALRELTEVSSQIQAAVLVSADGVVLASTLPDGSASERFAQTAKDLLQSAAGDAQLVQLEAATSDGSVFVVSDGERLAAAATRPEPTAGLVFYDLKSCLRAAAAARGDGKPRPRARRAKAKPDGDRASAA